MEHQWLVDIGINLIDKSYKHDLNQVLNRAYQANVLQMVITGTSEQESQQALALCLTNDSAATQLFSTAGIHPHHAKNWNSDTLTTLKQLLIQPTVKAVGECGLDFNRDFSPRAMQEAVFEEQLALAVELNKPVFLHERDANDRFMSILKQFRDQLPAAIVHCFTGDKKALYHYLDMDLHIGITGWICDERRGEHLQPLVKDIPTGRLMLETDGPYLLPRTLGIKPKNRRNEPAFLPEVLKTVAHFRNETKQQTAHHTTQCAQNFFQLPLEIKR